MLVLVEGAKVGKATWNVRNIDAEMTVSAGKRNADGNNIKYAMFEKDTTQPEAQAQSGTNEHLQTTDFTS